MQKKPTLCYGGYRCVVSRILNESEMQAFTDECTQLHREPKIDDSEKGCTFRRVNMEMCK